MADVWLVGGVMTHPVGFETTEFRNRLVPRYFEATFQFTENKDRKVTKQNAKNFPRWQVEILLRVTEDDSAEIIRLEIVGARENPPLFWITTKPFEYESLMGIHARHLDFVLARRAKLISFALQAVIQSVRVRTTREGKVEFDLLREPESVLESELRAIDDRIRKTSNRRLDETFLRDFAKKWNQIVGEGERKPVPTLQVKFYPDDSLKTLERYAHKCRKSGIFLERIQGKKISTIPSGKKKTKQKGKNGKTKKATKTTRN